MALKLGFVLLTALSLLCSVFISIEAQLDQTAGLKMYMSDALEWPTSASMSAIDELEEGVGLDLDDGDGGIGRRSLFWRRAHYYISYGALSANRVPCPPRSGRSYYTHNCYRARGPVHPYSRGCSRITLCRR